jgi:hypothetical protein
MKNIPTEATDAHFARMEGDKSVPFFIRPDYRIADARPRDVRCQCYDDGTTIEH